MSRVRIVLLAIGVVVLLAPVVMWVKGGTARFYAAEVEVRAPADQVFPYLTEPEKMKQWVSGLVESRRENAGSEGHNSEAESEKQSGAAGSGKQGGEAGSAKQNEVGSAKQNDEAKSKTREDEAASANDNGEAESEKQVGEAESEQSGEAQSEKGSGVQAVARPLEVGARSVDVIEREGERVEIETEVRRIEKNQLLQVRMRANFFDAVNHFDLTPTATGTRVTQNLTVSYQGFARFLAPFIDDKTRSELERDLDRLKRAVENAAAQPATPPAADPAKPN